MLEIRYRLAMLPGVPSPFAPWFRRTPDGCVHGVSIRFEGDLGHGRYLATTSEGSLAHFKEDLLAFAVPTSRVWRVSEEHGDVIALENVWSEPYMPGVVSPMKLAHDVLGPDTICSFTITRDVVVHRYLVPGDTAPTELWSALQRETAKFIAQTGAPFAFELERLGPWAPADRLPADIARVVLFAAFSLGYYDTPPRASVRDISLSTGVPGAIVLGHLRDVEAATLRTSSS